MTQAQTSSWKCTGTVRIAQELILIVIVACLGLKNESTVVIPVKTCSLGVEFKVNHQKFPGYSEFLYVYYMEGLSWLIHSFPVMHHVKL